MREVGRRNQRVRRKSLWALVSSQCKRRDASLERSLDSDELLGQTNHILDHFDGESSLKRLFWEVLSYDRVREALLLSFLPASLESQITHLEVFAESQSLTVLYAISMTGLDRTRIEHMAWSLKRRIPTCLILLFDQQRWLIVYQDERTKPRDKALPLPGSRHDGISDRPLLSCRLVWR